VKEIGVFYTCWQNVSKINIYILLLVKFLVLVKELRSLGAHGFDGCLAGDTYGADP